MYLFRLLKRVYKLKNKTNLYISGFYFALGGLSFKDKINAFYLRMAFEKPYEERPGIVKKKMKERGTLIELRHKKFNYAKLEYDFTDNYQMAICKEFFLKNAYDLNDINFIPEQIIDCGAFKGYFSILATNKFPSSKILSIEAHPLNYKSIVSSIGTNSLTNIIPINKAISASKVKIKLYIEGTNSNINLLKYNNYLFIETINLNDIIDKNKSVVLKVDIEGAEVEFFPEIINSLPDTCYVFLETHDGWISLQKIKERFIENGFKFQVCSEKGIYIDSIAQRVR